MQINLGKMTVPHSLRRAIAAMNGENGLASMEEVEEWAQRVAAKQMRAEAQAMIRAGAAAALELPPTPRVDSDGEQVAA